MNFVEFIVFGPSKTEVNQKISAGGRLLINWLPNLVATLSMPEAMGSGVAPFPVKWLGH